jgi:hypothetical protein
LVDEVLIARDGWTVENWFGDFIWFFIAADREFGKDMVAESQRILQRARGARFREDWKPIHPLYLIEAFIPLSESECPLVNAAN